MKRTFLSFLDQKLRNCLPKILSSTRLMLITSLNRTLSRPLVHLRRIMKILKFYKCLKILIRIKIRINFFILRMQSQSKRKKRKTLINPMSKCHFLPQETPALVINLLMELNVRLRKRSAILLKQSLYLKTFSSKLNKFTKPPEMDN